MYRNRAVTEKNSLKSVLHNSFRYTAAVSMQWVLFGSAGHKDMPPEGQLKAFNKCTGLLSKQMKCLGNTYWFHYHSTFRPTHVHQCNFRYAHTYLSMRVCLCGISSRYGVCSVRADTERFSYLADSRQSLSSQYET